MVRGGEQTIRARVHRKNCDNKPHECGEYKSERHAPAISRAEPVTDQRNTRASRHEGDEYELCERADKKRGDGGRRRLNALCKAEYPPLTLKRDHLLDDGMFRRLYERYEESPYKGSRGWQRIDGCIGKMIVATHMMMFTINRVLRGFFPSPLRVM